MTFEAPDHTSVNHQEFKPNAYVIAFAPELIAFVLDGQKLTTYRFGSKYDYLQVGDKIRLQDSASEEVVASATITSKSRITFGDMPVDDGSHEAYRDKEHQRDVISGYYAYLERPIGDADEFLVFTFELTDT